MEYKHSKFNILFEYNGVTLLFNSASSAFCSLKNDELQDYMSLNINSIHKEIFVSNGFWININEDEDYLQYAKRQNAIFTPKKNKHIVIAPTLNCNARCYYCYEQGRAPSVMQHSTIEALINFLVEYNKNAESLNISWFGGEPLLFPNLINEIILSLKKRIKIPITSTMTTNGSLINSDIIDKMLGDWNLKNIQITIDGTKEYYDKVKDYKNGKSYFEAIISNIAKLLSVGIKVIIRINISYENIENAIELLGYLHDKFQDTRNLTVRFMLLVKYTDKCIDTRIVDSEIDTATICERMFDKMFEYGFYKASSSYISPRNISCSAVTEDGLIIDPDGNLYKCQHFIGDKTQNVGDVFNGLIHNKIFADWCQFNIPDRCKNCHCLPLCQGGCKQSSEVCILTKYMIKKFLIEIYKKENKEVNL